MQSIIHQVESLLIRAEQAHGQYEQTILNGIYDQDWAIWYANYVIDQGIDKVLNRPFSGKRLSKFLSQSYEQYKAEQSQKTWAAYLYCSKVGRGMGRISNPHCVGLESNHSIFDG